MKDASVIVTVTSSKTPVVKGAWLKKDALVNVVGGNWPDRREVDDDVMLDSQVFTDTRDGCLVESGDVIQSGCGVDAEVGDVINGKVDIDFNKMRVFTPQGMAVEDLVAAKVIFDGYLQSEQN